MLVRCAAEHWAGFGELIHDGVIVKHCRRRLGVRERGLGTLMRGVIGRGFCGWESHGGHVFLDSGRKLYDVEAVVAIAERRGRIVRVYGVVGVVIEVGSPMIGMSLSGC